MAILQLQGATLALPGMRQSRQRANLLNCSFQQLAKYGRKRLSFQRTRRGIDFIQLGELHGIAQSLNS